MDLTRTQLRPLAAGDPERLHAALAAIGWARPKTLAKFERYLAEQADGRREACVALVGADPAGYVTLLWQPRYQPLAAAGLPEIQDLNVLPAFRRRGLGTRLLAWAEARAATRAPAVGIGVGLHPGYNVAQRLYGRRGYVPDGHGVTCGEAFVQEGQMVRLDDELVLHLVKELT